MDERLKLSIEPTDIQPEAWQQIEMALKAPFLRRLAVLPNVQPGHVLPTGSAALLDDYICPDFLGREVGCGMTFFNTGLEADDVLGMGTRGAMLDSMIERIPVKSNKFNKSLYDRYGIQPFRGTDGIPNLKKEISIPEAKDFGTLGNGNHFVEFGVNSDGILGLTVHSGSRGCGEILTDRYSQIAKEHGENHGGIYYLPAESKFGSSYYLDQQWATMWARASRVVIASIALQLLGCSHKRIDLIFAKAIDTPHNFIENCGGSFLHRKGVIIAEKDFDGIVAANMRDGVYIVRGVGNKNFLNSASHGAGRKITRKITRELFDFNSLMKQTEGLAVNFSGETIEEIPDAFKDVSKVLHVQYGQIINVIDHYEPIIVMKG